MAEYIDRNALIKHIRKDPLFGFVEQYGITGVIESFPTADVQPVKHGRWIPSEDDSKVFGCSECHEIVYGTPNYCPNCGADMREES